MKARISASASHQRGQFRHLEAKLVGHLAPLRAGALGAAQEAAELGVAERKQRDRERRRRDAAADEIEKITAERDKLAAERDQALAERDQLQAQHDKIAAELADNQDILAALSDDAEKWQAERDQLMEVLKLPGMKTLLAKQYDPDKPGATEAEKRKLNGFAQKVNVAYDLIKKDARAKKGDEAA